MFGESIVAAVVCRYGHDSTCTVTGQYIITYPDGYFFSVERVDGVCAREDTAYASIHEAFAFGTVFDLVDVSIDGRFLFGCRYLCHIFAFRGENHERNTENRVGACREDSKGNVGTDDLEFHFSAFGTTYPVTLGLFEGVAPIDGIETVEQTLGVGRYPQAPLTHHFLLDGVSAAYRYAFAHFVVGQHGSQLGTPVHHRVAEIGDAVVEQGFLLFFLAHGAPLVGGKRKFFGAGCVYAFGSVCLEGFHQSIDGVGFLLIVVVVTVEHLYESPLRPFIIFGVACAYLAVPVETESYLVELFPIAVDILFGGDGGVLSRLYGVLFGGQPVSVVTHRVQHVETFEAFEAGVDIRSDISEGVSYVQSGTRRIGKHIQHIEFGFLTVFRNPIGVVIFPILLPFLLDFSEIVVHRYFFLRVLYAIYALQK